MSDQVMASWWPAEAFAPGDDDTAPTNYGRCRVYVLASGDLVLYPAVGEAAFRSPIVWDQTDDPPPPHPPQSWDVTTEAGLVRVTPRSGCGCGHPLKRWTPDFAAYRTPWRRPA